MKLKKIENDVFNIAQRIRKIDKNYIIKYNTAHKRYEIFYKNGLNEKLQLVLPYDCLDFRTIKKIYETKIENIKKIIRQMEEQNEKLKLQEEANNFEFAKNLALECAKKL